MKTTALLLTMICLCSNLLISQDKKMEKESEFVFYCKTCHICEKPTKRNPCLRECPRAEFITIHHKPEEGPDRIKMDEFKGLSDDYNPVVFTHKLHAEMSGMAGGCALCHHNNPPGNILPCRDCHELKRQRTDISKPDLLASYHRQCMDCHREWGHSVSCTSCHTLSSDTSASTRTVDMEKTGTRIHPEIKVPTRLLYETDCDEGKIVTFYHNEHAGMYGFECIDCHQRESCIACHDKQKPEISEDISHDRCENCHDTDGDCEKCHFDKAKPPFDHLENTRFDLASYHAKLKCTGCHGSKMRKLKLKGECTECHPSWNSENFEHSVTGLILDENHYDLDCVDCHLLRKFSMKPSCTECHDDDISYPKNKPGKVVLSGR